MSDPRGFLVLGPEASGTRLVTSILLAAGCAGSSEHEQPYDKDSDWHIGEKLVVVRRSFPHCLEWPSARDIAWSLGFPSREITAVVTTRDWWCNAAAQLAAGHVKTLDDAFSNIRQAYCLIFEQIWDMAIPMVAVSYESLIDSPVDVQESLARSLKLNFSRVVPIRDENRKHWMTMKSSLEEEKEA